MGEGFLVSLGGRAEVAGADSCVSAFVSALARHAYSWRAFRMRARLLSSPPIFRWSGASSPYLDQGRDVPGLSA